VSALLRSALLILLLLAGTAHASHKDDLEKLRKRIAALQQEFEKTSASKSEVADSLRKSERAISNSKRRLHELAQQQQTENGELSRLQQRASATEKDIQAQRVTLGRLIYQRYLEGGEQAYLMMLLNNSDPNRVAREFRYFEYVAQDQAAALQSLQEGLARLHKVTEQVNQKRGQLSALRAEAQDQQRHLEQEKRERQQVLRRISLQLKQQRREIGRLQRDENRLSRLVENLAGVLPDAHTGKMPFSALKGKLLMPVKGSLRNRFGARRPESNMTWTGWFVRARASQPVRAVAAGHVVYADWLRGFGNLLIIDHGQGYMSLYGYNETLYKQVGDTLHAGDIIADVGSSGGSADSGLYFELRFKGKPFDPARWIGHKKGRTQ
jgi:septal ring factor EnvC (AmiA/AmiB activator)